MDIKDSFGRVNSVSTVPGSLVSNQSEGVCKILIVHSEGNINNNPNLSGLVEILCENGYFVDIASPLRKEIVQKSPHPNARLILVDSKEAVVAGEFTLLAGKPLTTPRQITEAVKGIDPYDFIFGVDQSIIEASFIARVRQVPYGLISYEIFFEEEAGKEYKAPEIMACRNIAFAVCQDPVRAAHLCRENQIPPEKILYIPVAGRGCISRNKDYALHDKLGIEHSKKIAMNSGSLTDYCMINELCQSAAAWPNNWALVLHNRYGLDENTRSYRKQYSGGSKIYFSCDPVDMPNQMHLLLNSADIGIALYKSLPNNKWTGNNIRYVGLASGKIATYLQHGLPVLINEIGVMSDCVRQYNLGKVHPGPLPIQIAGIEANLQQWSANAHGFFREYLDLDKTSQPLLQRLKQFCVRQNSNLISVPEPERMKKETTKNTSILLATSLAPKNIEMQQQCVASWIDAGFEVISVNTPDEVKELQPQFKTVRFIPATRDGRKFYKKPLIFIDDLLLALKGSQSNIVGIINSDIQLRMNSDQVELIRRHATESMICVNRTNIDRPDEVNGSLLTSGFDLFFFSPDMIDRITPSLFCLGVTWWDYYLPMVAIAKRIPLLRFCDNIAFHVNHETNWDMEQWIRTGKYFFEKVVDISRNPNGVHPLSSLSERLNTCMDYLQKVIDNKSIKPVDIERGTAFAEFINGFLLGNTKVIGEEPASNPGKVSSIQVCDSQENRNMNNQDDHCDVSIILGTKNRAKLLDPMLNSLKDAVEGIRYEVIVIEGDSSDNTSEVLHKHGITQIYNESQHLGPGRHSWPQLYNYGFSKACGKWAMYASDDIIFGKGSIRRAVELLNKQKDEVAGGIFFYKNAMAENEWSKFGIDFTYGPKLLMNYGLVRLDDFKLAGGLDERYKFYCADGDLCYKLYQSGKQLIPLPGCFVVHNNVLDVQKKVNVDNSGNDIELYKQKWKHFVSMETPNPRRLLWQDDMQHDTHTDKNDILSQIKKLGLWTQGGPLRLHLGCGQQRLKGYVNIDYPPSEHTVQQTQAADIFADITQLDFSSQSVDEIRLHHVFEHFDRPAALALLCKWHLWLKTGGRLVVETPDFDASIELIQSGQCSYSQKQAILRHLFGSHEADWAVHKDGWYGQKFQSVFGRLGFDDIRMELNTWGVTRNITVCAVKSKVVPLSVLTDAAKQILCDSMIDQSDSEKKQWNVWCEKLDEAIKKGCGQPQREPEKTAVPKTPKVSIYMSMYNTGQYLAETLDSILNQTFTNWELVIVDDGSADNSLEVAGVYQKRDSRIRVSAIPHVGVVKARNEALRQCHPQAVYLMNHDSDDISLPDKLRRLVDYLDTNSDIAIVGCFAEYFGDGSVGKKPPYLEWQPQQIRRTFGEFNSMIHSAAMMRHEVVRKIGCYRDTYPPAEDYEFFALALMAGFECANIPEVLHRIRLHRRSLSAVHGEVQQAHAEKIKAGYRQYLRTSNRVEIHQESVNGKYAAGTARACVSGNTMTLTPAAAGVKTEIFRSPGKSCLSILHTVEFYAPHTGGAEEVIRQLSERLVKRGHRVTVATTKLPERNFRELNGVEIKDFDIAGNYARGFQGKDVNQYVDLAGSDQFDVMFNYAAQQWATDLAFISLESAAGKRVNVIAPCGYSALSDAKTLRFPQYAKYFNQIIPACLPRYDAAVYHSAMYKDYEFAANHGFTNSIVIPNGTSEEEFSNRPKVDFRQKYGISTKYFGLCVANFYPGKGHQTVIQAVRQMNRTDFTLVFIGKEGQLLPEMQQLAAGLNIRFCVNIPRQDTVAAYQAADMFLFGSEIEASPLVIIEAKASRTPFVTTDVGNVREWKGGIVCTPEKMAYYAGALLDNESMRKNLAEEGWNEWKQKLTWESVAERYEQLYLSLQKARQKGAR